MWKDVKVADLGTQEIYNPEYLPFPAQFPLILSFLEDRQILSQREKKILPLKNSDDGFDFFNITRHNDFE